VPRVAWLVLWAARRRTRQRARSRQVPPAQVSGLRTADCALVFFPDGEPAYSGAPWIQAASGSASRTSLALGKISVNWLEEVGLRMAKITEYEGSYQGSRTAFCVSIVEPGKWRLRSCLRSVAFNYVRGTGDAHWKNFSILRNTDLGDFVLSPA